MSVAVPSPLSENGAGARRGTVTDRTATTPDAALVFALTAVGAPGQTAISAVIGYRLLTGWLPMAPALLVLGVLARRSALPRPSRRDR
ncbi:hypothetical protein ACIA8J_03795 [Streptomyces asoensis]|uniref:hypothetical protein n=1 Tax=Streptomyces asoensis TaxID=249586 RepID=UPI00379AC4D4